MKKCIIVIIAVLFSFLCANMLFAAPDTWTQKEDFGGTARSWAVGFSIGSKGYIGTGYNKNVGNTKDFWEYDPYNLMWTQKADFGGTARSNAVGFSIGSKGYIGTGGGTDFWEYDPVANTCTQKLDFGGTARWDAIGFSIGSKGYIGTGTDGSRKKDFWEYDPVANTWTQKLDFGGTARSRAVGFSIGSKGYIGTGNDGSTKKDFWEYDPAGNTWTQKTDFGGVAREYAVGFSIESKGYIGTGGFYDFWEYEPVANSWTQRADGGTARSGAVGFSIGTLGGYIGTGIIGTNATKSFWVYNRIDTTPVQFTFTDQTGVALSSVITSNTITVSGINVATPISITGGTYAINGGAYTSASGTVANDDTVTVQQTSSASYSTKTDATLTIGYVSDTFSVTTLDDTTPDPFTFSDRTGVALSTVITSNTITVSGISIPTWIAITGGEYSINGGAYTILTGAVNNGDTVAVRQTSSGSYSTTTDATLTISGVSDTFSVTTQAVPVGNTWTQKADFGGAARYYAVGFSIGIKGYIGTGYDSSLYYKDFWEYDHAGNFWTQKADFGGTARYGAVGFSIGSKGYIGTGYNGSLYYKDFWEYDPAANTWTQKMDFGGTARYLATGFSIGSKGYIGTGKDVSYLKDFWEYDPAVGTDGTWTQKVDFGGTVRYEAVGFSVGSKGYIGTGFGGSSKKDFWEYDSALNTWAQKTDFGGTARWKAVGFSIGGKGYIGLGTGSTKDFWEYESTDTTPESFTFTDQTGVALSTVITSNTITVSGINTTAPISITVGQYSINGGAYTSASGTVSNGNTVTVQQTSAPSYSTTTDATLTVGSLSGTFRVTTMALIPDATPDAFTFIDQTDVALSTIITSNTITVSGINVPAPISITGGQYSINGGAYTSASGTVNNGNTVTVQQTSSASYSTTTNATLIIGGVTDTFSVTTLAATPPVINSISDDAIGEGTPYTGPTPSLSQGTLPVTWSLVTGPGGMGIDSGTGVVSWANPTSSGSPHLITIHATNTAGSDTKSWQLTVTPPPGVLSVTPSEGLSSSGSEGGPFDPLSTDYTLENTGGASINWQAAKTQGWVTLSAAGGSLAPAASITVTVSINSAASSLTANTYNDTVTFTNTTNGDGNTTRGVMLTVEPCPKPAAPTNPSPGDTAIDISLTTDLDWDDSDGATSYDVYFGTTYPPEKVGTVSDSAYDPGLLDKNTLYYWRIVAKNDCGDTTGDLWQFTTAQQPIHIILHRDGAIWSSDTGWNVSTPPYYPGTAYAKALEVRDDASYVILHYDGAIYDSAAGWVMTSPPYYPGTAWAVDMKLEESGYVILHRDGALWSSSEGWILTAPPYYPGTAYAKALEVREDASYAILHRDGAIYDSASGWVMTSPPYYPSTAYAVDMKLNDSAYVLLHQDGALWSSDTGWILTAPPYYPGTAYARALVLVGAGYKILHRDGAIYDSATGWVMTSPPYYPGTAYAVDLEVR
jgi:hypothetical protein